MEQQTTQDEISGDGCVSNDAVAGDSHGEVMSKNQRKRLAKQELRQVAKLAKKEREKEKKRELAAARRADREQRKQEVGSKDDSPRSNDDPAAVSRLTKEKRDVLKASYLDAVRRGITIIIDCSWEDKHTESTLKSLTQQIMYCYGCNRRHTNPAQLHLTGLGPRMRDQLTKMLYSNWTAVQSSEMDYTAFEQFYIDDKSDSKLSDAGNLKVTPALSVSTVKPQQDATETVQSPTEPAEVTTSTTTSTVPLAPSPSERKQLVYLTSDAEETIEQLDTNTAYIIGGIVDRNRHKGATFQKAQEQGVRTAKLPIKENFELSATHVLTVNHVFEILLNFHACGCWRTAIERVLPKRKGLKSLRDGSDAAQTADEQSPFVSDAAASASKESN